MVRDETHGDHEQGLLSLSGEIAGDLIGSGFHPANRTAPALEGEVMENGSDPLKYALNGLLNLRKIGIPLIDHLLREGMGRKDDFHFLAMFRGKGIQSLPDLVGKHVQIGRMIAETLDLLDAER